MTLGGSREKVMRVLARAAWRVGWSGFGCGGMTNDECRMTNDEVGVGVGEIKIKIKIRITIRITIASVG